MEDSDLQAIIDECRKTLKFGVTAEILIQCRGWTTDNLLDKSVRDMFEAEAAHVNALLAADPFVLEVAKRVQRATLEAVKEHLFQGVFCGFDGKSYVYCKVCKGDSNSAHDQHNANPLKVNHEPECIVRALGATK